MRGLSYGSKTCCRKRIGRRAARMWRASLVSFLLGGHWKGGGEDTGLPGMICPDAALVGWIAVQA
eukprot:302059-Chlamydomonas_euryale.AAC.5